MLFVDVCDGITERSKTSYVNTEQATVVLKLFNRLIDNKISKGNVVVMSPYSEQVSHIQELAKKNRMTDLHITTVHRMQGSEAEFIILNLVRSVDVHGLAGNLGFVDDVHMMCVGLSRQKVYVIIVADATFLHDNTIHWNAFIDFMKSNNLIAKFNDLQFVVAVPGPQSDRNVKRIK